MAENMRLVRIWDRNYNLRGQQFVNWHNGFTVPSTDPMAVELWDNRELQHQVTVESTNELAWYIDRLDRTAEGTLVVTCRPHLDILRRSLVSDAYLVDLWLEAEKRWKATLEPCSLRDRIAAAIVGHADYVSAGIRYCSCGWVGDSQYTRISFAEHVADVATAVIREENDEIRPALKEALASWGDEKLSLDQTFGLHERGCVCDDCLPDDID